MALSRGARWALVFLTGLVFATTPTVSDETKTYRPEGARGGVMVSVPEGEYYVGCNRRRDRHCDADENPYHKVKLDAYYIDQYEVTIAQYRECVEEKVCRAPKEYSDFDADDQPAVGVSWNDATTYCEWAGKRLPTEAEWEQAARGPDGNVYPWGNYNCGCECAVQEERQLYGCGKDSTLPVGTAKKGQSPYGTYDQAGNVWEWVYDWYDPKYFANSETENPKGPETGEKKVRKGGGFANVKNYLRTSDRSPAPPEMLSNSTGFRCAKTAPPEPEEKAGEIEKPEAGENK